jgi:hypothetical protein
MYGMPVELVLRAAGINGFADDVSVTSVPGGFLDHMNRNPSQVTGHLPTCARCVEINGSEDYLRSSDLFFVVGDNGFDRVIVSDPKAILVR